MTEPTLDLPPTPRELAETSNWLAERPGLPALADELLAELPFRRTRAAKLARRLSTPALNAKGIGRTFSAAGRAIGAASAWATKDAARAGWDAVVNGEREHNLRGAAAYRMQKVVRASGPAYVKLGQFIATSDGMLPTEIVEQFSWCRDAVPAFSARTARRRIEAELGAPISELFASFDDDPIGAASIGQVHAARLHDGTDVVVKIRRPGIREEFCRDIRALALMAAYGEHRTDLARRANAKGFVRLFASLAMEELDFRIEAANMVELGLASEDAGMAYVRIPRPHMATERILVMERLPGLPYTEASETLDGTVDRQLLLRAAIQGVIEHTLVYGAFHGDLHAGNVLVDTDGTYGLIDFGIVGRMDVDERVALIRFLVAFASMDIAGQLNAISAFDAVPDGTDLDVVANDLAEAGFGSLASLDHTRAAEEIGRLVRILYKHHFELPTELVLFFKNLLYLNGLAASIAPETDLLSEIAPIFAHFQTRYPQQLAVIGTA